MNNKEIYNEFKKQVAVYKFEQEYKENKRTNVYPLKKDIKEWRKYFMKKRIVQTVATLIVTITLGMTVYAGTKVYENIEKIWKTPETYEFTNVLSEEDKKNAISEEEARKKASDYLEKIGLENEVGGLTLRKDAWDNKVIWDIGFKNGTMTMNSKGEFEYLNIPSYTYTIPKNYGITREQARIVAKELLSKYNPNNNDNEYELVSLKRNGNTDEEAYIWYADFYKKYENSLNMYEKISIGWIPTINGLYSLSIENSKYENNEQIISKEEAIKIAKEKDEKIETRHKISSAEAEIGIDKMNTDVIYREKDIEEYDKGTINFKTGENGKMILKDDAVFYKVENRVRKVWEVTLYYDYTKYEDNGLERYVYFIDSTTGEVIGGNRWSGAKKQIQDLISDPYNVIEK